MTPATATPEDLVLATPDITFVPVAELQPSPLNPRKAFGSLDELAASIAGRGVISPLVVRSRGGAGTSMVPHFEIVDGERRYRAAKQAGVAFVPVIRRDDLTDSEVLEIQLISSIQRQDLTPLEEARGYRALLDSNPSKYSAAYIADRISRSEKYVVDRMRLLQLLMALQQLLDDERIGVGHAELLAKLKPEDQARAAGIDGDLDNMDGADRGGLWDRVGRTLDLELEDDSDDPPVDPFHGLKPVTVKELEAWIARHVRFDVAHAAATAPLDFGETAIRVEAAAAKPGRGKKVIAITADYRTEDDARSDERVFGVQSWRRADGTSGTSRDGRNQPSDSPTCDHSVLGVFTVGPGYGTSLQVCIARDRCQVHWAKEIKEREKNAKLRAAGQGAKADSREKKAELTWQQEAELRRAEEKKAAARYAKVYPLIAAAIEKVLPSKFDRRAFEYFYLDVALGDRYGTKKAPACSPGDYIKVLVMRDVADCKEAYDRDELNGIAKHWGVDVAAIEKPLVEAEKAAAKAAARPIEKPAVKPTAAKPAKKPTVKPVATKPAQKAVKKR